MKLWLTKTEPLAIIFMAKLFGHEASGGMCPNDDSGTLQSSYELSDPSKVVRFY